MLYSYFIPNPAQLIYTHFPDDPDWQLLQRPLSLQEFEALAPVKIAFFKYNLELLSHKQTVVQSGPELEVKIGFPRWRIGQIAFTFTLSFENGSEDYHGLKLSRFGTALLLQLSAFLLIIVTVLYSYFDYRTNWMSLLVYLVQLYVSVSMCCRNAGDT